MRLVVGAIGKPHGIRGHVSIAVRTDAPDERFAVGSHLETDPTDLGPLAVEQAQWHAGRLLVRFRGVHDRAAAERLRGGLLVVDSDQLPSLTEPDEFYDYQLVGLTAVTVESNETIGEVIEVIHSPGADLLAINRSSADDVAIPGKEVLIPFNRELVPTVDCPAGRIVIDPPPGLLEL